MFYVPSFICDRTNGGGILGLFTYAFFSGAPIWLIAYLGIKIKKRVDHLGKLPDYLGITDVGMSSFITLGVAMTSSTILSDAYWQRAWSAKDDKSLIIGSVVGSIMIIIITFLFGFGGFIASWAGLVTDPNLAFLELLKIGDSHSIPMSMLTVICLIATTMNESAVDSHQIAIGDTLISFFESLGYETSLNQIRLLLVVLPLCFGMLPYFDHIINDHSALFGSLSGLVSVVIYAIASQVNGIFKWDDIPNGLYHTFYEVYEWPPFVIALGCSVIGMSLWYLAECVYYSVTGKQRKIPNHLYTAIQDSPFD
ncbi:hypothetical protein HDV06_004782 [Boothiomyces sp. JEL0866]|nr:hypothetical protein HDV06_004782 [Boothiomyces sp. JEL0866]